jgi:hypothetical protein
MNSFPNDMSTAWTYSIDMSNKYDFLDIFLRDEATLSNLVELGHPIEPLRVCEVEITSCDFEHAS